MSRALTESQRLRIIWEYQHGCTRLEISAKFSVSYPTVKRVIRAALGPSRGWRVNTREPPTAGACPNCKRRLHGVDFTTDSLGRVLQCCTRCGYATGAQPLVKAKGLAFGHTSGTTPAPTSESPVEPKL